MSHYSCDWARPAASTASGRLLLVFVAQWMSSFCAAAVLTATLLLSAAAVSAQMHTAEITGQVKDPSGALIPGVTAVATMLATQQKYTAVSNESGQFLLSQLPVGEYTVTVTATGFKQAVQEHVVLHVGDHGRQDFELQVGEQEQQVTVQATGALLQVESAEIKDVIQNEQVVDLPLKGREFLEL